MTGNTSALVQSAPSPGKPSDTSSTDRRQASSKDAAAAFQSVLKGMKDGDAPIEGGGRRRQEDAAQAGADQGNPEAGNASDRAEADAKANAGGIGGGSGAAQVAFSTSNLVDALRDVSHTVLAPFAAAGELNEGAATGLPDGLARVGGETSAAALGLSSAALFAAQPAQNTGGGQFVRANVPGAPLRGTPEGGLQQAAGADGAGRIGTSSLFAQFGVEPEAVADPLTGGGRGSLLPEEASGTVKILQQETHFAPNMRLSPAQQVGDQLASALKSMAADDAPVQTGLTHKAEGPVLKTLDIQLNPHELGTVKVSLRMVGDSVEVTLQTSNPQTADLLKQDRLLLDQMLRTTGFKADTITIQAADDRGTVQSGANANGNSSMGQNGSGPGSFSDGQAQNGGRGNNGQRQDQPQAHDDRLPQSETVKGKGHEDNTGISLSDGIYL